MLKKRLRRDSVKLDFRRPLMSNDNKYKRGVVAVAAGSDRYPGAAVLAVGGARAGGAGYIKYLSTSKFATELVLHRYPDVVPITSLKNERCDALLLGPGGADIRLLPASIPIVLDSSALRHAKRERSGITVVTPHEGELGILGYDLGDRGETAHRIAAELGVIVVLKGARTLIVSPEGDSHIDTIGGAELATAGSGDVLAGLIASLLASWRPANIPDAHKIVSNAVTLHSLAGSDAAMRKSQINALDIIDSLALI